MHMYICIHIRMCRCMYTQIYIYIYIHIHMLYVALRDSGTPQLLHAGAILQAGIALPALVHHLIPGFRLLTVGLGGFAVP